MGTIQIEKGDTISTKDGQTYRVLSVFMNGDALTKIEGIDENEKCPMRRPVFSNQIARVLKKAVKVEEVKTDVVEPKKEAK